MFGLVKSIFHSSKARKERPVGARRFCLEVLLLWFLLLTVGVALRNPVIYRVLGKRGRALLPQDSLWSVNFHTVRNYSVQPPP